jgi:hypothetical protein
LLWKLNYHGRFKTDWQEKQLVWRGFPVRPSLRQLESADRAAELVKTNASRR